MWIPEVKVRSSDFVASTITDWTILLASEFKSFNNKPIKIILSKFSFYALFILDGANFKFFEWQLCLPLFFSQSIFELDSWFLQIYSFLIFIFGYTVFILSSLFVFVKYDLILDSM